MQSASYAQSEKPANSTKTSREELVSLLERTIEEVKASRKLLVAYEVREKALVEQVAEYKASNKILDAAYIAAVNELAELRATIKSLREAIAIKDREIELLKSRIASLEKTVTKQRKTILVLGTIIVLLGSFLIRK